MDIIIKTPEITYNLKVNRKITVLRGDSGTGKTSIIEIVDALNSDVLGISISGIDKSKLKCIHTHDDWEHIIDISENSVILVDEDCDFMYTKEFAEKVYSSSNRFLLISRDRLRHLNISASEVFELLYEAGENTMARNNR